MVSQGFFSGGTRNTKQNKKEDKPFFSQRLDKVKVAQAGASFTNPAPEKKIQPLSEIGSEAYKKEVEGFIKGFKDDFNYRNKFDVDTGERKDKYGNVIEGGEVYGEKEMRRDYPFFREFRYERNPIQYQQGIPFGKKETKDEGNILTKTGNFITNLFTPPAVAGTLEGKPTRFAGEADPTPRPKLDYVNPDKTTMTGSEIRDAFSPSNLFGYIDKFGC